MKKGKPPPIEIKLTKANRLHNRVFKEHARPEPNQGQMWWLERNCLACANQNTERMVESKLTGEDFNWRHICVHRGPVWRKKDYSAGRPDCMGFSPLREFHEQGTL